MSETKTQDASDEGTATGKPSAQGCTSFFPSKPLGCYGDGGALFTNNIWQQNKSKYSTDGNHFKVMTKMHNCFQVESLISCKYDYTYSSQ